MQWNPHLADRGGPPRLRTTDSSRTSKPTQQAKAAVRVVVADDHPLMRLGLRALVDATPDLKIVGCAADSEALLEVIKAQSPDIALLDAPLPRACMSDVVRRIREGSPHTKILVLTSLKDGKALAALLELGAEGYVVKRSTPAELLRVIRIILAGQGYVDPTIAAAVQSRGSISDAADAAALSERELSVLKLVAGGFSNKEIAAKLGVSIKSVQTYKTRAAKKLNLQTRADFVRYGAARGWMDEV